MAIPTVTIGLPVYNGQNYLDEAIKSILGQTYEDFELIVSDNASTDATEEIVRTHLASDGRIRYVRNPSNVGAAGNYNQVFHLAASPLFKWAAHDDVLEPRWLEACVAALDDQPEAVLAYTAAKTIDPRGHVTGVVGRQSDVSSPDPVARFREVVRRERRNLPIFGLMRARALAQTSLHGTYHASVRVTLAELALRGPFAWVPEELFLHRRHPASSLGISESPHELRSWFDPTRRKESYMPRWEFMLGLGRAARMAPISLPQRLACYLEAALWGARYWNRLAEDVSAVARRFVGSLRAQRSQGPM